MPEEAQEILEENGYTNWGVVDEVTLTCPHGATIEWDGQCPQGCVSPLRVLGMI